MITDLYSERLHLRKMKISDAPSLFDIWSDSDVTRYMNVSNFTNENQAKEMIYHLDQLSQNNEALRYSIVELSSNEIIGSCGYNFIDFENAKAEIGYDIAKKHWGKGYAKEAIASLMDYAFNSLEFNRIEAKVEPENVNSIKVLHKLHFIYEGTMRQAEKSKGTFVDLNIYSKLKSDNI
ncbi:GNAT family N-acetyltransferase [Pontibacillus litoralis]|uniref:GNAT family acetyltransferase n=1 Tax=Pontibacillus litoralis JSM 072002 TaxID=1385512 RepID=A0A0A5HX59_9BACI|nr:GNAT family protein [Pontibacillus litoralis]KGX88217.1 GNAT family acetyltransferase [Pontibacillus litoralis JSM 072002]